MKSFSIQWMGGNFPALSIVQSMNKRPRSVEVLKLVNVDCPNNFLKNNKIENTFSKNDIHSSFLFKSTWQDSFGHPLWLKFVTTIRHSSQKSTDKSFENP